ncbi:hypothetical protein Tco_0744412 [Tanacetum coccineum]
MTSWKNQETGKLKKISSIKRADDQDARSWYEKRSTSENKGKVSTEMKPVLELTQQEALFTLRQKPTTVNTSVFKNQSTQMILTMKTRGDRGSGEDAALVHLGCYYTDNNVLSELLSFSHFPHAEDYSDWIIFEKERLDGAADGQLHHARISVYLVYTLMVDSGVQDGVEHVLDYIFGGWAYGETLTMDRALGVSQCREGGGTCDHCVGTHTREVTDGYGEERGRSAELASDGEWSFLISRFDSEKLGKSCERRARRIGVEEDETEGGRGRAGVDVLWGLRVEDVFSWLDEVSLVDGIFDGAFGGVRDEEVVVGEGVVRFSSSFMISTKSCFGGMMVSLILLKP